MTTITNRNHLRKLAATYAEITQSDEMERRRKKWQLSNTLQERTVPFVIEDNGTYFQDLMPALQCEDETEREFEAYMQRVIINYETIPDDRVFPPYLPVSWEIERPYLCPSYEITKAKDATGRELGYESNTPMSDLANSFHLLKRGEFKVNREKTYQKQAVAEQLFGDILPARIINNHTYYCPAGMACKAVNWMGMENFYMGMLDQPENIHRFFGFLATESEDFLNWLVEEDLVKPNHKEYCCGSGSIGFTDELPKREISAANKWLPEDCWGFTEAQEAVGISNDMYAEFIFPYQKRLAQHFGLIYYGCCEPVHALWPTIKQFKNLRKLTVSPWCDQQIIADSVGKDYVLSRKPHPMQLCGETFNPESFTAHIKETLAITKNNFVELIFRDTCTLNGNMKERLIEACKIIKKLIAT
jgi:hypothetical protein